MLSKYCRPFLLSFSYQSVAIFATILRLPLPVLFILNTGSPWFLLLGYFQGMFKDKSKVSMEHLSSSDEHLHHNIEKRGAMQFFSSQVIFLFVHTETSFDVVLQIFCISPLFYPYYSSFSSTHMKIQNLPKSRNAKEGLKARLVSVYIRAQLQLL